MALKAKLLLDSSDYNKKMDQVKAKASSAGKEIKQKLQQGGKGFQSINKFGGKFGGVLKNLSEGIAGLMSPIGLVMAGVAALGSLAVKVWDKMTQSAEQYGKKVAIEAQRTQKAYQNSIKDANSDSQYIDRLTEISEAENASNEMKMQAVRLIDILTSKYGDLGINIDLATGKITGLNEAQQKFLKLAQQVGLAKAGSALKAQQVSADNASNKALGYQANWLQRMFGTGPDRNNTPADFGGGSHGTSMATYWNHMALANGERGLKDKAQSWLSNDEQKKYAKAILEYRKSIKQLQAKMQQNPNSPTIAEDKKKLQNLKLQENHAVAMLKLEQRLKVARAMIKQSKTGEDIDKWKQVEVQIEKTIALQKQYYAQQKMGAQSQTDAAAKARKKSQQSDVKGAGKAMKDAQKSTELAKRMEEARKKQQAKNMYSDLSDESKINVNEKMIANSKKQLATIIENKKKWLEEAEKIIAQEKALEKKIKDKSASKEQQDRYLKLGRQKAELVAKNANSDVEAEKLRDVIYNSEVQIEKIRKRQKQYYDGTKQSLDDEISLIRLKLQGKNQQAERQKIINDLKAKGIKIDQAQIDKIMKKKRQLGRLNMISSIRAKGEDTKYQIEKYFNPQQAEINKRIKQMQQINGHKLTKKQKNTITRQIQLELKASDIMNRKPDLSDFQTFTNELASRGGFSSSVVSASKNDVNERIYKVQKQSQMQLKNILAEMKRMGVIG